MVLVVKKNGQIRICVDFQNLNEACPKDDFPLPIMELRINATTGHDFMDGCSGYNQIRMAPKDEELTAFRTIKGIYCYKVIPFGLKNVDATYQRAMQKIFDDMLHKFVECYVNDLVVKTKKMEDHLEDHRVVVNRLRKYDLKMNPLKCIFGVMSGKFLRFIVQHRGIENGKLLQSIKSHTIVVVCLNCEEDGTKNEARISLTFVHMAFVEHDLALIDGSSWIIKIREKNFNLFDPECILIALLLTGGRMAVVVTRVTDSRGEEGCSSGREGRSCSSGGQEKRRVDIVAVRDGTAMVVGLVIVWWCCSVIFLRSQIQTYWCSIFYRNGRRPEAQAQPQLQPLIVRNSGKQRRSLESNPTISADTITPPIQICIQTPALSHHPPHFLHLRTTQPNPRPSGLFFYRYSHQIHPEFDFLSLLHYESPSKPPFKALTFVDDPSDLRILQSCNGLLLCRGLHLYIYNPTTSQFATLPQPPRCVLAPLRCYTTFYAYNLAFDPSKSPHYKVVSINFSWGLPDHYELDIVSSETGLWSPSADPFNGDVSFNPGVFWNGALHWISTSGGDSLYFNVDEDRLETMPMPPIPDGWEERRLRYFGESRDHLHLIEIYGPRTTQFNVYAMERDYRGWFVKYRVDIDAIPNAFLEMIRSSLDPSDLHYYQFVILGLIREEKDEESFLVLHIPGKVISIRGDSLRFDVDKECLQIMLMPPLPSGYNRRWFNYFGESG
ncbi:uncharacterized protein LOC114291744 [Camellia sinensis]|uniref:uncharacterized protein LOC114291744 n=1 Tax=Camellia sinensis TaxID=4442 RepID=UPI00103677AB|nr:uncharacterized protein LOC114291744 [Camellia sinensis]